MTLAEIPSGAAVLIDANVFLYYLSHDPVLGPPCEQFLLRVETSDVAGFTSAHLLSAIVHRLMAIEAMISHGWPQAGIASRLKRNPSVVRNLTAYRKAVDDIHLMNVQVLPVYGGLVSKAVDESVRLGLLSDDALVVAVMNAQGLVHLASHDADFDRAPGLIRYAPV